jgi:hypothetical protein
MPLRHPAWMQILSLTLMKKRLAENPDAIGYIDATQVDASVKVLF